MSDIKYRKIYCETCGEKTSHVQADDYDGEIFQVWQCEICGDKR